MFKAKAICYGIDLGTTNSCIAVYHDSQGTEKTENPEVIENQDGEFITPSVVCFDENHVAVGKNALDSRKIYPKSTFYCVKRFIGRTFNRSV